MVQVLPYVPTFIEGIAPALQQAAGAIGSNISQKRALTALQKFEEQAQNGGGANSFGVGQIGKAGSQQSHIRPIDIGEMSKTAVKAFGKEGGEAYIKGKLEQQKLQEKEASQMRLKDYDRRSSLVQKDIEKDVGRRELIRKERQDLKFGLDAVQTGDVGGFDINWLADRFGPAGEPLKSAKGVQLESATKNLLLDSIQKATGRPNQWIEQQIKGAIPSIGKSKEANETLFAIGLAKLDIEEKLLDTKDELLAQYEQAGITPPSNLDKITHDLVKPYAQQVEDRSAYDLRVIFEKSKGETYLNNLQKVPQGTPLTLQKRDALLKKFNGDKEKVKTVAEKLGYMIPDSNVILRKSEEPEQETEINGIQ